MLPPNTAELNKDTETSIRIGTIIPRNTAPFNVWRIPSISIPCGFTSKGMPIGLQISGANGNEETVLQLAHAYEQATDWHKRAPQIKT
jgi:aspartyl-tRNA(Asn)/glutamyl-tRNA(Gln) amidotransferase subunit A